MSTLFRHFALLGLSCTLAATPALAASEAPQSFVHFSDLDLTTQAGQHALHGRVLKAVDAVCGRPEPGDFGPSREAIMNCRNTALVSARPQVQIAMANAHGGKSLASNERKNKSVAP